VIEDIEYSFIMQENLIFQCLLFSCTLLKWLALPFWHL